MTAPGQMQLPPPKLFKDVLDGLLGKDVTLMQRSRKLSSVDAVGGAIALYVDDNNRNRALIGWNVAAAANAGCAFGLMPAKTAESVVRDKFLPADIVDCVSEMSNVLSSALEKGDNPHVKLQQVYSPAAMAPNEIAKLMYEHFERMDFEMDVPGYGTGLFSVVVI